MVSHLCLQMLMRCLKNKSANLKKLNLSHVINELTYNNAVDIAEMLEVNQSLQELNISKNYKMLGKGLLPIFYSLTRN